VTVATDECAKRTDTDQIDIQGRHELIQLRSCVSQKTRQNHGRFIEFYRAELKGQHSNTSVLSNRRVGRMSSAEHCEVAHCKV
jgi:hypothetical protein